MKAVLPAADNISVYFCIYIFKTQNVNENSVMFLFIIDSKGCEALRPMSIVPFFKNAPLSRQFLHKLEVFCWKILVKAKKSAVPFLSNCCLKIFFELF